MLKSFVKSRAWPLWKTLDYGNSNILRKEGVLVDLQMKQCFNLDDSNRKEISETLKDVYLSLDEKATIQLIKS